ncbi:TMV resistance protein N-like [Prosopis cineraria]|uniref:TMV resistance protein N-like n=1 Tax=Prosopis cineraria TaxID=364024 RepID=UPI00240F4F70|nr:TMV resistance protein N-like [Prosopis cineraria]
MTFLLLSSFCCCNIWFPFSSLPKRPKRSSNGCSGSFHCLNFFNEISRFLEFQRHRYSHQLHRSRVRCFASTRNDVDLHKGHVIKDELLQAIKQSMFTIVVLSDNYASSSSWCLNELQKIAESKYDFSQTIFPIFYAINPSVVRHQKGKFAPAF